ncbi:MAG: hypothetical protein KF850_26965 [Labilithrix sp.]|nr:hypothetical protein [Labilithrix sp.]
MALDHPLKNIALLGAAMALAGCGVVGWQYRYGGHQYTMTRSNIDPARLPRPMSPRTTEGAARRHP